MPWQTVATAVFGGAKRAAPLRYPESYRTVAATEENAKTWAAQERNSLVAPRAFPAPA